jgi:hypothetical protein
VCHGVADNVSRVLPTLPIPATLGPSHLTVKCSVSMADSSKAMLTVSREC